MDYEPLSIWKQVCRPNLFLFAETDEWVPIEAGIENYRSATAHLREVTLRRISDTSHLMSVSRDWNRLEILPEYLSVLLDWLASRFH